MVHHVTLIQLQPSVTPENLEQMMVETRIRLLKIQELSNVRVGKRIDSKESKGEDYGMFYSFEVENMDKLRIARENAVHVKFHKYLEARTVKTLDYNFEMEPGKDVKYS